MFLARQTKDLGYNPERGFNDRSRSRGDILSVATERALIIWCGQTGDTSICLRRIPGEDQMVAEKDNLKSGVPHQFPFHSLLFTDVPQAGWGTHMKELTAVGK